MGAERACLFLLLWPMAFVVAAQAYLDRPVDVQANDVRLSEALSMIAQDGGFKLSYNAALFNGDSLVSLHTTGTAEQAFRSVLGDKVRFVVSGAHVILVEASSERTLRTVRGRVVDAASRAAIPRASVYATGEHVATSSAGDGSFTVEVADERGGAGLLIARAGYNDTLIYVGANASVGDIALVPREKLAYMEPICAFDRCAVEDLGAARLLVSNSQLDASANLSIVEESAVQFSLWPGVGTNGPIGGAFINHASFNLLAGYASGVQGVEFGVGMNLIRRDVKGVQFAGLANLVGRNTRGVQFAGALNHTMGSLEGLQIAGLGNTVWDTLNGVQIAGAANVVKGGMRGTQISGAVNVTTQACDGAQISGGFNVTVKEVRKMQIAGGGNYGRKVSGAQVAGGINVVLENVGGGQVAAGINYARRVTGGQVAVGINVAIDTVIGGQVAVLNFARVCSGGQVGILNFSDTIMGSSVGLLSFAWRGYHRFDVVTGDAMPLSLQFRTGTRSFHNILGYSPAVTPDERWGFLYGFGTESRLGRRGFLNIDLTGEQVVEQREWVDAVNILGRLSVSCGYRVAGPLVVTTGPVLNMFFTDWYDPYTDVYLSDLAPEDPPMEWISGTTRISGWFGWKASLGLSF